MFTDLFDKCFATFDKHRTPVRKVFSERVSHEGGREENNEAIE